MRRSTGCTQRSAAMKVAAKALQEAEDAAVSGGRAVTLRDACNAYVGSLEAEGKVSATSSRQALDKAQGLGVWTNRLTYRLSPDTPLSALTDLMVSELRLARLREGLKPSTVALELRILRAAVKHAKANLGARVGGITWRISQPKGKTRWLTPEEWQAAYDSLDPDEPVMSPQGTPRPPGPVLAAQRLQARDLLVALTMCGGRWGEVSRMTVDQVLPDGRVRLYGWKTKKERIIQAPPMFAEVLERRKAEAIRSGSPYLFQSASSDPAVRRRSTHVKGTKAIRRALDRAGCNAAHIVERDGTATIHSLRHTFASLLRQRGVGLDVIVELLGHSSVTMTMRYAHIVGDDVARASAKVIEEALGGGVTEMVPVLEKPQVTPAAGCSGSNVRPGAPGAPMDAWAGGLQGVDTLTAQ